MKVEFTLKPHQEMILRILRETGKIHYPVLERVFDAVGISDSDFDAAIKIIAHKKEPIYHPRLERSKTSILERMIEELIIVNLVKRSAHHYDHFSIPLLDPNLSEDDVSLTSEGERVAKNIKEKRRLILGPAPVDRKTVFIACAFGREEIDQLYELHFKPACEAVQYGPMRIDMTEPQQSITAAVLENIRVCACMLRISHTRDRQSILK